MEALLAFVAPLRSVLLFSFSSCLFSPLLYLLFSISSYLFVPLSVFSSSLSPLISFLPLPLSPGVPLLASPRSSLTHVLTSHDPLSDNFDTFRHLCRKMMCPRRSHRAHAGSATSSSFRLVSCQHTINNAGSRVMAIPSWATSLACEGKRAAWLDWAGQPPALSRRAQRPFQELGPVRRTMQVLRLRRNLNR